MAKKKTSKRTISKRNVANSASKSRGPWLTPWFPLVGQLLCIAAVVYVFMHAFEFTRHKTHTNPKYALQKDSVSFTIPKWMNVSESLDINFADILEGRTLFDDKVSTEVKTRLEESSLVASVQKVDMKLPNKIFVSLTLRRPVVKIESGNKTYYMDSDGVVLSPANYHEDRLKVDDQALPLITSKSQNVRVGQPHPSKSVRSVLKLLRLWDKRDFEGLDVLEISCEGLERNQRGGHPDYIMFVTNQTKTVKLAFDTGEKRGEIDLNKAMDNFKRIVKHDQDLSHVPSYVDLRWGDPSFRWSSQ